LITKLNNVKLTIISLKEFLPQVGSKKYLYDIVDNRIIFDNGDLYNQNIDFIITEDYDLMLGFGHYKLNKKDKTLLMAGEMIVDDYGRIKYINNNSGHYQPSKKEFKNFVKEIKNKHRKLLAKKLIYDIKIW